MDGQDTVAIDEAQGEIDIGRRLVSGTFVMLVGLVRLIC